MLVARFVFSQMDVPARQAYVTSVVRADERSAAGGITNVVRSVGLALAPMLLGELSATAADGPGGDAPALAAPFFVAAALKCMYDVGLYSLARQHAARTAAAAAADVAARPGGAEGSAAAAAGGAAGSVVVATAAADTAGNAGSAAPADGGPGSAPSPDYAVDPLEERKGLLADDGDDGGAAWVSVLDDGRGSIEGAPPGGDGVESDASDGDGDGASETQALRGSSV
jgi:hypothetical protein